MKVGCKKKLASALALKCITLIITYEKVSRDMTNMLKYHNLIVFRKKNEYVKLVIAHSFDKS